MVRFSIDDDADNAIERLNNTAIDVNHTMRLERAEGSEEFRALQAHDTFDQTSLDQLLSLPEQATIYGTQILGP